MNQIKYVSIVPYTLKKNKLHVFLWLHAKNKKDIPASGRIDVKTTNVTPGKIVKSKDAGHYNFLYCSGVSSAGDSTPSASLVTTLKVSLPFNLGNIF